MKLGQRGERPTSELILREVREGQTSKTYNPPLLLGVLCTGVPTPAILGVEATALTALFRSSFSACAFANSSFNSNSAFDSSSKTLSCARRSRSLKCCSRTDHDTSRESVMRWKEERHREGGKPTRVELLSRIGEPVRVH